MENKYYVYLHIKETTGEPFYVGKGKGYRATRKAQRTKHWNSIVNKYGYDVIFLEINLTEKESLDKEIYWINRIGRKDLGLGPLINYSNGGDGTSGYIKSKETIDKLIESTTKLWRNDSYRESMSNAHKGQKAWNKGLKMSKEMKYKISGENNYMFGKLPHNAKIVLNLETGIYYNSSKEASLTTKYKEKFFSRMLSGDRKNKTSFIYA